MKNLRHAPFITCLALALTPAAWAATETFTTIGTTDLELPSGVTSLTIECRGGGGAGGSATRTAGTGSATSGGGAGGNYARTVLTNPASGTYKVTVGGGGVSLTTVATNDSVAPGQQGGTSKFTDAAGTVPEIALATGGAGGRNARISTTTTVALLGGDGDTTDNRGDVIFSGGNGGDAGTSGGGGGGGAGDAADAPDVLVSLTGGAGGTLGGGNGSSGRGAGTLDNPASQGAAPGGGGGGVKIQANGTNRGGNGGAGTVKLTYIFASGLEKFAVAAASPQIAGVAFDVTVTALNGSDAVVDIGSTVVSVSSPAGSLMEFDWNSDGDYGDNSGTLTAGTKTIKARNKKAETKTIVAGFSSASSLTPTPASVTTTAAAFAKLQILAPGETAAPGTDTGRSGTPTGQGAGVAFNARVNAVDEFWNLVSSVTDTVAITSTDGVATLPADAAFVAGTKLFSVTLNTEGVFTLTATDVTDGTKTAHTTQGITVTNPIVTWDAGNTVNGVTIDPADGTWNTTAGNIVWNDAGTNIVWNSAKQALFAGADGTYAVTVGGSFDAQKIRFENSGYNLSSPSIARTITLTIPSGGLTVASGKSATIGTNVSVNGNSTYFIGAPTSSSNGGTLNVEGTGATVRPESSGNSILIQGIGTIVNVKTGGFLGLAPGIGNSGFTVGTGASSDVSLNVDGGTVNVQSTPSAAGSAFNVGGEGKATVTLSNSGAIIVNPGKTNGVTFGSATSNVSTNTLNLDGGTLTTRTVRKGAATSTAIFNFNGGTLQANSSDSGSTFMTGLNQANVKSGGALIDTVAFNVTIGQNLLDGTGGGGLTKLGSGTLTLTGANTYTGPTAVNSGTLLINGNHSTATGAVSVTGTTTTPTLGGVGTIGGAVTLGAVGGLSPGSAAGAVGTLTINNALDIAAMADGGTGKLAFQLGPIAASDTIAVTGALTIGPAGPAPGVLGFSDFTFTGIAGLEDGTYPLITGASSLIGGLDASNLTGNIGTATGTLQITGNNVELVVINDPYIAWAGAGVLFDADANNDGVDNGLAWLLGAANPNDNATGKLPVITQTGGNLKMTFDMLPIPARGTAQLFLEHSSNLGTWSTGVLVPDANGGTAPVTFIVNDSDLLNPNNPLDVEATVSSSEAAAGKLFGRLKAVK